jgi:hypothetical protein
MKTMILALTVGIGLGACGAFAAPAPVGTSTLKIEKGGDAVDVRGLREQMHALEAEIETLDKKISVAKARALGFKTLDTAAKNNMMAQAQAEEAVLLQRRTELLAERAEIQTQLAR